MFDGSDGSPSGRLAAAWAAISAASSMRLFGTIMRVLAVQV